MATRPPPLLLTKRLTSFLHLNLSATITTLLLLTPSGKLLAYASNPPTPVATLRTHATVAASLYAIHSSGTDRETIDAALGGARARPVDDDDDDDDDRRHHDYDDQGRARDASASAPLAVTIQLESGSVLVIRRLRCGMLFVCLGPPESGSPSRPQTMQHQQSQSQSQSQHSQPAQYHRPSLASAIQGGGGRDAPNGHHTPSTSPPPSATGPALAPPVLPPAPPPPQQQQQRPHLGSPSEAASILSAATAQTSTSSVAGSAMFGAGAAGVMAMRRHAEELARWLDDKLGTLELPGDGLGGVL